MSLAHDHVHHALVLSFCFPGLARHLAVVLRLDALERPIVVENEEDEGDAGARGGDDDGDLGGDGELPVLGGVHVDEGRDEAGDGVEEGGPAWQSVRRTWSESDGRRTERRG